MDMRKHFTVTPPETESQNESLWDVGDAARYLNVSRSTVRRRVEAGTIPYVRIGNLIRFVPADIEEWVRSQAA
jgi:excisionase family DNA binding protein